MNKQRWRFVRWIVPALLLALLAGGCSQGAEEPQQAAPAASPTTASQPTLPPTPEPPTPVPPTSTPIPTEVPTLEPTAEVPTPEPTPEPAVAADEAVVEAGIFFQDDFTGTAGNWPSAVFGNYYFGYHEPEYYHVEVHAPNDFAIVPVPGPDFTDFTVEADVFVELDLSEASGDYLYGLTFRGAGRQFYAFTISPNAQTWQLLKSSASGGLTTLAEGPLDPAQGLGLGPADPVSMRVDAAGADFRFLVNGNLVGRVSDAAYPSGQVGLLVETFDNPRVHVHYDKLTIREALDLTPETEVVYQEDFTDPSSDWPSAVFANYYFGYHEPEYYHVEIHAPNDFTMVPVPGPGYDDFVVKTDVFVETDLSAPEGDFRYGLAFRAAGRQYYAFTVSPRTQTWQVLKSSASEGLQVLAQGSFDTNQGLGPNDEANLLVYVAGPDFYLHINDEFVGRVTDSDYSTGQLGLFVETFDSPRVHMHYDELAIGTVEDQQQLCRVLPQALNLRDGPGTGSRTTASLAAGQGIMPLGRNPDSSWLWIRTEGSNQLGWVSSSPSFVSCPTPSAALPVVQP